MKKCVLLMMGVLLLTSCSQQQVMNEVAEDIAKENSEVTISVANPVNEYLEKARWGDGNAFLKLAECYHKGIGVKPDFMGTITMLTMAGQYGQPNSIEEYIMSLPETDEARLIFEAMEDFDHHRHERADSVIEMMIANGSADGYALRGILQIEQGDTIEGKQTIQTGAQMGSSYAEMLLCAIPEQGKQKSKQIAMDMLAALSDRVPLANQILGNYYSGIEYDRPIDVYLAAKYYKKADEHGCLGKRPAQWLLDYYRNEGIAIDSVETRRLQTLCGYNLDSIESVIDNN